MTIVTEVIQNNPANKMIFFIKKIFIVIDFEKIVDEV
jgi:hypothetical protein